MNFCPDKVWAVKFDGTNLYDLISFLDNNENYSIKEHEEEWALYQYDVDQIMDFRIGDYLVKYFNDGKWCYDIHPELYFLARFERETR